MGTPRREGSADSAARFLVARDRPRSRGPYRRTTSRPRRPKPDRSGHAFENRQDRHGLCARCGVSQGEHDKPPRIAVDFAEPTLRLIRDVLLDAMHANVEFGDRGALLMIAEQMIAVALGMPPWDDPPLTDREVG